VDAETARWAWGLAAVAFLGLVGVIYAQLTKEDSRLARNIHDLRNYINQVIETRLDRLERDKQDRRK
jgi:hypothetical protein